MTFFGISPPFMSLLGLEPNIISQLSPYNTDDSFLESVDFYIRRLLGMSYRFYTDGKLNNRVKLNYNRLIRKSIATDLKEVVKLFTKEGLLEYVNSNKEEGQPEVMDIRIDGVQEFNGEIIRLTPETLEVTDSLRWKLNVLWRSVQLYKTEYVISNVEKTLNRPESLIYRILRYGKSMRYPTHLGFLQAELDMIYSIQRAGKTTSTISNNQEAILAVVDKVKNRVSSLNGINNLNVVFRDTPAAGEKFIFPISMDRWESLIDNLEAIGVYGMVTNISDIVNYMCDKLDILEFAVTGSNDLWWLLSYAQRLIRSLDLKKELNYHIA